MLNIKEISKATKASYVQKATSDIFKRGSDMSTAVSKGDHYAAGKETKKATKRATTINKLIHKGLYNKEDVEIEESMLKNPYKGMDKDKLQAKHKSFNRQIADLQNKKMKSNMGAGGSGFDSEISKYKTKLQHVKNAMKEATLNELSPETLKRYKDAVDKKHTVKGVTRLTSTGQVQKFKDANQMHKRDTGVARATNRLNKK